MNPSKFLTDEKVTEQADDNGLLSYGQWPKISVITPSFNQGQFL